MMSSVRARYAALALGIAAALVVPPAYAQGTASVSGTVLDSATSQPVPGVQVTAVGTPRNGVTDVAGRYSISGLLPGSVTLRARRIGYSEAERTVTLSAAEGVTVNFILAPVARVLSEVVSTGYGTTIRRDLSSSVASVQGEEVTGSPLAGVDAALQGKAPGVQVIQNAGNPGVGITVRVRGASSLSANNQPLWVVDGVPMIRENYSQLGVGGQDITAVTGLSPDEIESIDILKDAAAASIYGSRAANGVVMITTKRGRLGRPRFTFNAYTGVQEITKKLDLVTGPQFVELINEARVNDTLTARFGPGTYDGTTSTDWQEAVLRTAPVTDAYLSVDGGSERVRYLVGGSFFKQEGIVLGSGYGRQTLRANLDFDPNSRMSFKSSVSLSREVHDRIENDNTIEGVMANAIAEAPIFPIRQPDGRFTDPTDRVATTAFGYINPVAVGQQNFRESRAFRSIGSLEAAYRFTDRLRLTARGGLDVLNLRDLGWDSPNVIGSYAETARGISRQGNNTATKYVLESFLGYDQASNFGQLSLTGGGSVEYNQNELDYLRGEGFAHTAFQYPGNAGSVTEYDGDKSGNNLVSFFSRANLTLRERYLLSASVRADGSSRFGEKNQYGVFPAVSVGWIVSDEPAFTGLRRLADFKLRASYGETGNQDIGDDFAPIARYSEAKYAGAPGLAPENIANPELRWETNKEYDVGFDLGLMAGRVLLVGDWYSKETEDLLVERPISLTTGFASLWDNVGSIQNRGFELGLTTTNIEPAAREGLRWETNFNISWNRNRVTMLYGDEPFNRGFDDINRYEEGHPMGAFYTLKFTGVDPATGNAMFYDKPDDEDDRVFVGSPHPDYWGGLTNTFSFKGFDLRGFVQFSQGAEIYNGTRAYADDGGVSRFDNKYSNVLRRWRQPGDITDVPRLSSRCHSDACIPSSRWVEDASYIRLQEVTLGYRIPLRIAGRANFSDARIYVSGRNLKTWTDYTGFNPEANSAGSGATYGTANTNTTISNEFYSYPLARTISFGVQGSW